MIEPCPGIPWWVGYEMLYCGFTSRSLRLLCLAEQFNTVTTISASCHCWKYFFCLTVGPSCIFRSVRDRLNQHQSQPNHALQQHCQPISIKPCKSYYYLAVFARCSPKRPNRQLGARRAHLPASTFTTTMAINYLGIIIGFPVLLDFAITQPPWAFDTAS